MRKTLLLFTGSYPYSVAAENTFLPQEIEVLARYFDTVMLIPTAMGGDREPVALTHVVVNTEYARFISSNVRRTAYALLSLGDPRLWRELLAHRVVFVRPSALVRAVYAHVVARMTERWMRRLDGQVRWADSLLYTWWFDGTSLGLATFGNRARVPVITRAHGRDLFESRQTAAYIPFRRLSLERISRVFSASHAGARYMSDRYPAFREKISASLLGTADPGFLNAPSSDGVFRLVSCSFLIAVKRIDLMLRGIAALGRMLSGRHFEWTHIGVGPEKRRIESLAGTVMPANVCCQFMDYPGKAGLFEYYRAQPADLFINTSKSEGTPVAMMEAISVGIPVVATAVGGNSEIVTSQNGLVMSADPEPQEIADTIAALVRDPAKLERLRAGSRDKWQKQYSASDNYTAFAETIRAL